MLIPVRCFTCHRVIAHLWETYNQKIAEYCAKGNEVHSRELALNDLGFNNYCCRRMMLGHVDVIDNLLLYAINPGEKLSDKYEQFRVGEFESEEEEIELGSEFESEEEEIELGSEFESADDESEIELDSEEYDLYQD